MTVRGISLVRGTIVVLDLDGTLAYIEDVQPTHATVVALPEQLPERRETIVFTPGRVGGKKISPYSAAARTVEVKDLSERNRDFIGSYEQLRTKFGPNHVARTPEEQAAKEAEMAVTKVHPTRAPRGSVVDKQERRRKKREAKVPCVKCANVPAHLDHHNGTCEYEAPARKTRGGPRAVAAPTKQSYSVVNPDLTALQAANEKFAQGNRFHRVFVALSGLPESTGTSLDIIRAVLSDNGKPLKDAEKVVRRALAALCAAGNVQAV